MLPLSFRFRVPLFLSLVALTTGICIAVIVLWHDHRATREESAHDSAQITQLLARAVTADLATEDVWNAFQTLRSVVNGVGWVKPEFALVLNESGQVWVSSDPVRFPLLTPPDGLGEDRRALLSRDWSLEGETVSLSRSPMDYYLTRIHMGDVHRGVLLLGFDSRRLYPRYYRSAARVLAVTGVILLVCLPLGWRWGGHLAEPLIELENCVTQLGEPGACVLKDPPRPKRHPSELSRLRQRVRLVAAELHEKRSLERQMIRSERQAALGRLAAGVAHEINNPLGGMLTAIATFRHHGHDPAVAEKTISLLERGLQQIRHTVSVLLVEVRAEPRALTPLDLEDVVELVGPSVRSRQLHLAANLQLPERMGLPAGPLRQVLLNLLLNAIYASPPGGALELGAFMKDGRLDMWVANEGESISDAVMERLFEPFTESRWGGAGLGLWISDQTLRQLQGSLRAAREGERTVFRISVPCADLSPS
ncbi:MAG: HAMP domain-containing histidine kinase [Magnetococcus sp. WYHC-3]